MGLGDQVWRVTSIHEVVLAFLQAERGRFANLVSEEVQAIVNRPDTADPQQNWTRTRLLFWYRQRLLGEVPLDTVWHEVKHLQDTHLDQLSSPAS